MTIFERKSNISLSRLSVDFDWLICEFIQSIRLYFLSLINTYFSFAICEFCQVVFNETGPSLSFRKQARTIVPERLTAGAIFRHHSSSRRLALVGVSATAEYQLTRSVCVDKRGSVRVTENPSSSGPSRPDRPRSPLKYTAVWPVPVTGYNEARWGLSVVAWRAIDNLSSPNYTRPRRAAHLTRDALTHVIHI